MAEPQAQDKTQQVVDLLAGKPPVETPPEPVESPGSGDITPPAAEAEPAKPVTPTLTPTDLAERLGIKPSEFYAQLHIPVDGGEPMTLSEFKDAGKELRGLRVSQDKLAEERVAFENSTMRQRQTLQAALGKVPPGTLTPEMIEGVQAEHTQYVATERRALVEIRPDLNETGAWSTMRELLVAHLAPYGFHAIEIDGIIDHRLAKYVIDNAERQKRLAKLEAEGLRPVGKEPLAKPTRSVRRATKSEGTKAIIERGKRSKRPQDKAAAVAELLG